MHSTTPIPTIRVDIARPPEERYDELCRTFGPQMLELCSILDELLEISLPPPWGPVRRLVKLLLRIMARRMRNHEETRELRGISRRTGVKMHLLVALNVLLDCMMGCTSGAALVKPSGPLDGDGTDGRESLSPRGDALELNEENGVDGDLGSRHGRYSLRRRKGQPGPEAGSHEFLKRRSRLMHFRTLDWGMDQLRQLLVVLEYVDSSSEKPDHVLARSITHAGFVGVLTGVREGLSLSLNFRPNHSCSTRKLRLHQLAVIIGLRTSAGSLLRSVIVPESLQDPHTLNSQMSDSTPRNTLLGHESGSLRKKAEAIVSVRYPPCYLTLCDSEHVCVIEKDLDTGLVTTSRQWSCITNHDLVTPSALTTSGDDNLLLEEGWLKESTSRRRSIQKKWEANCRTKGKPTSLDVRKAVERKEVDVSISEDMLKEWVQDFPIMNECTHFGCIMDPETGEIRWLERGLLEWDDMTSVSEDRSQSEESVMIAE